MSRESFLDRMFFSCKLTTRVILEANLLCTYILRELLLKTESNAKKWESTCWRNVLGRGKVRKYGRLWTGSHNLVDVRHDKNGHFWKSRGERGNGRGHWNQVGEVTSVCSLEEKSIYEGSACWNRKKWIDYKDNETRMKLVGRKLGTDKNLSVSWLINYRMDMSHYEDTSSGRNLHYGQALSLYFNFSAQCSRSRTVVSWWLHYLVFVVGPLDKRCIENSLISSRYDQFEECKE